MSNGRPIIHIHITRVHDWIIFINAVQYSIIVSGDPIGANYACEQYNGIMLKCMMAKSRSFYSHKIEPSWLKHVCMRVY